MKPETRKADEAVSKEIGARIKALRLERGWPLERIADMLGVTYQQVQKYETGRNKISIGKLDIIARAFDVPFAELLPANVGVGLPDPQVLEIAKNIARLDAAQRQRINVMVRAMSGAGKNAA